MTTNNKINSMEYPVAPWKIPSQVALMVGTGMIMSGCASVRTSDNMTDSTLANKLIQKLDERDKLISDLQHRVQQLESKTTASTPVNKPPNPPATVAQANPPEKTAGNQAQNQPPPAQKKPETTQKKGPSAAGSFDVDEDAAQRALERTLVQTGALLLPFGQAEIQPFVTYLRTEAKQPFLFANNNNLQVSNAAIRKNEFDMGANLLVGLPFDSQAELRIPYQVINQSVVTNNGSSSNESNHTVNSLGDIGVGLAKTVVHEKGWIPDLIARLTWDTASGHISSNNIAMGGGFNDFIASLTALKRQDPLAFTGRLSYQRSLKKNGIEPGDQIGLTVGATLAASPQTSLSIGLQQTYAQETKINNIKVQGSDNVSSVFTVGASSTIGHHLFFSVSGGIGLTQSAPDYFFNITIPFRFDVPYKVIGNKL
ncbi:transporter [Candidatus Methylobacter oryzae]|uniref:Transporter n=1 Tax=Candidatus Methylobacter oryzae TaxID=2497749 RepID=A0ABY3CI56_9GAMM|nr:transporter [Candidatus Methylobacter oryzae]TRX02915.1 hypothetical protein EKO24_001120 [Candidatus Methylobacter oryzae]